MYHVWEKKAVQYYLVRQNVSPRQCVITSVVGINNKVVSSMQEISNIIKVVPDYKEFKNGSKKKHASKVNKASKSLPVFMPLMADGDQKMQTCIFSATLTLVQS